MRAAESQHALLDQRALHVVVFQNYVLAQGFDGKITVVGALGVKDGYGSGVQREGEAKGRGLDTLP